MGRSSWISRSIAIKRGSRRPCLHIVNGIASNWLGQRCRNLSQRRCSGLASSRNEFARFCSFHHPIYVRCGRGQTQRGHGMEVNNDGIIFSRPRSWADKCIKKQPMPSPPQAPHWPASWSATICQRMRSVLRRRVVLCLSNLMHALGAQGIRVLLAFGSPRLGPLTVHTHALESQSSLRRDTIHR